MCEAVFNFIRYMLNSSHERCLGGLYRDCPLFIHQQEKTRTKNDGSRQNAWTFRTKRIGLIFSALVKIRMEPAAAVCSCQPQTYHISASTQFLTALPYCLNRHGLISISGMTGLVCNPLYPPLTGQSQAYLIPLPGSFRRKGVILSSATQRRGDALKMPGQQPPFFQTAGRTGLTLSVRFHQARAPLTNITCL